MRWSFGYHSPSGKYWDLSHADKEKDRVFILDEGLSGFFATFNASTIERVGRDGALVLPGESRLTPTDGSLQVGIYSPKKETGALFREWINSWSGREHGWFVATPHDGDTPQRAVWCRVRLSAPIAPPEQQPESSTFMRCTIDVINDDGALYIRHESSGEKSVEVSNYGVSPIYPRIEWTVGGEVKLPSGATFILPSVGTTRIMHLDPAESFLVTDKNGVVDRQTWLLARESAQGEPVMPRQVGFFSVPDGAKVYWNVGVESLWA